MQYYLFHTLLQNIYFTFLKLFLNFFFHKVASKTRLSIDVRAKETAEARLHKFNHHLVMPSESKQHFFEGN